MSGDALGPRNGRSIPQLQLAGSVEEFAAAVSGRQDELRTSLYVDFGFIVAYWLIFASTSALFATRSFWGADWLATIAGELATLGALADVAENVYTLKLLRVIDGSPGAEPRKVAGLMRTSSIVKWLTLFVATGLFSIMFFQRGGASTVLGFAYAVSAGLGVVTVAANVAKLRIADLWLERMASVAFYGMGAALIIGLPVGASQT
jgi:hypothetical protein